MNKDRTAICEIISDMFDSDKNGLGIYPTTETFNKLEKYIEHVRAETVGWCYADACVHLDNGIDYRYVELPSIYERAKKDLSK